MIFLGNMIPFVDIISDMFRFTEKMARISHINEQKKTIEINESLKSNIEVSGG